MAYKKLLSFFIPFALFTADIFLLGLLQQPIVFLLLCFYAVWLFRPNTQSLLICGLFFLAGETAILYDSFSLALLYLLPLTTLFFHLKKLLGRTSWLPYAFLTASIAATGLLIKPFMLKISPNPLFTGAKLCVNLIIVLIIEKFISKKKK